MTGSRAAVTRERLLEQEPLEPPRGQPDAEREHPDEVRDVDEGVPAHAAELESAQEIDAMVERRQRQGLLDRVGVLVERHECG